MIDPSIICWVIELDIEPYRNTMGWKRMIEQSEGKRWWAPGASGMTEVYSLAEGLRALHDKTKKYSKETYRLRNIFTGDIIMGDVV